MTWILMFAGFAAVAAFMIASSVGIMVERFNVCLTRKADLQLDELKAKTGASRSAIICTAISRFFDSFTQKIPTLKPGRKKKITQQNEAEKNAE